MSKNKITNCPLCGTPCRVVGDVTMHYEPVKFDDLKMLALKYRQGLIDSNMNSEQADVLYSGISNFIDTMLLDNGYITKEK